MWNLRQISSAGWTTFQFILNKLNRERTGLLNFIEVNSNSVIKDFDSEGKNALCHVFEHTMVYYDSQAQLAKETLHDVIFYALLHEEGKKGFWQNLITEYQQRLDIDYNTDFDVPSFENCMTVENYMDLIQHFTLYTYLKRELWNMDREVKSWSSCF